MSTHSILRPGFMVSLKTSVAGGVSYQRTDLTPSGNEAAAEGSVVAKWETTKVVEDPAEHERASKVRNEARSLVSKVCAATAFGLLCPETREAELLAAVAQARALVSRHNEDARCTRVSIYVMTGKISSSDEESARAIGDEVRTLIQGMSTAIDRLDPDAIREAANRAQKLEAMLAPEQAGRVGAAVMAARKAARDITRRVTKGGELAAVVLMDIQRGAIEQARIAFLDLDEPTVLEGEALPGVDLARVGSLEIDDEPLAAVPAVMTEAPAPALDMEAAESPELAPAPAEPAPPVVHSFAAEMGLRLAASSTPKTKRSKKAASKSGVRVKGAA